MAAIPDPVDPESFALNETGELMGGVWIRELDADGFPVRPWRHVGWTRDVQVNLGGQ